MPTDDSDSTNVDFDASWECCCRRADEQPADFAESQSADDSHIIRGWSPVILPHVAESGSSDRSDWWYRKHFTWLLPDAQQDQRVYLVFEPSTGEKDSAMPHIVASVWLNGEQILSDSALSQEQPIEFTRKLRRICEFKGMDKLQNLLVVRCTNASLRLHAHLIMQGTIFWPTSQSDESNGKEAGEEIGYAVRVNGFDRCISVTYTQPNEDAGLSPSSPAISISNISEDSSDENDDETEDGPIPRLTIVILIVGTRGDVQPFIALGKELLAFGHRVRLATHEVFRTFIRENGLEFYPLAGNPADLMSFVVKNAGIIPSMSSIVAGDVGRHRQILAEILASTWLACTAQDGETGLPFTAEAIIANPPSFGHVHCAEKLQIPLHMMFTMPWTPTTVFPHPFCNIESSIGPTAKINFYSYHVVDMLTWSGMRGIVNHFRREVLGMEPLSVQQATNVMMDERVPHTYCWSPSLVAKPPDWQSHVDVVGFFFLDLCTNYDAPQSLLDFLGISPDRPDERTLPSPIFIGFGSITGHDSRRLLKVVLDALDQTGYRAVLSGLATDEDQLPSNVFRIDNVPHDWLFQHVWGVCHHGGAGTTAAGLRAGKPTIIVPFFGDQFFWGGVVEKSGAGPHPLPGRSVTGSQLADAFDFASQLTTRQAAERVRAAILTENGCQAAVRSFHAHLPIARMRSHLQSTFAACYRVDGFDLQISRPVAHALIAAGLIGGSHLRSHSIREWPSKPEHKGHRSIIDILDRKESRSRTLGDEDGGSHGLVNSGSETGTSNVSVRSLSPDTLSLSLPHESESPIHDHLAVPEEKKGLKSIVRAVSDIRKGSLFNLIKRTWTDSSQLEPSCPTANALFSATQLAIHPAVCSHPTSSPWFGELAPKTIDAIVPTDEAKVKDTETPELIQTVAAASGFHPEICEQILREFDQIKTKREPPMFPLPSVKPRVKRRSHFRRQRSRSTSDLP